MGLPPSELVWWWLFLCWPGSRKGAAALWPALPCDADLEWAERCEAELPGRCREAAGLKLLPPGGSAYRYALPGSLLGPLSRSAAAAAAGRPEGLLLLLMMLAGSSYEAACAACCVSMVLTALLRASPERQLNWLCRENHTADF